MGRELSTSSERLKQHRGVRFSILISCLICSAVLPLYLFGILSFNFNTQENVSAHKFNTLGHEKLNDNEAIHNIIRPDDFNIAGNLNYEDTNTESNDIEKTLLLQHTRREEKKKSNKDKSLLDTPGIRVLIAIGVFMVLNAVAICVHHVIYKMSHSASAYRSIEHNLSPF